MKLKTFLYSFSLGCCSVVYLNVCFANEAKETVYVKNSEKENLTSQGDVLYTSNENDKISNENFLIEFNCSEEIAQSTIEIASPVFPSFTDSKVLSYGDNFSYNFQPNSSWVIKNATTQATLGSGTGNISNFNFPIPGDYIVEVSEVIACGPGQCEHAHDPSLITIYVSPHKMTFDFSTIAFQEPIIGGASYTDMEVTVVVNYQNYYDQTASISSSSIKSAGVLTNFVGAVDPAFQNLSIGSNEILYKISGQATKDTYIMFDFVDINNQVVSYYYPTKIN